MHVAVIMYTHVATAGITTQYAQLFLKNVLAVLQASLACVITAPPVINNPSALTAKEGQELFAQVTLHPPCTATLLLSFQGLLLYFTFLAVAQCVETFNCML